jgi:hypothetical protein
MFILHSQKPIFKHLSLYKRSFLYIQLSQLQSDQAIAPDSACVPHLNYLAKATIYARLSEDSMPLLWCRLWSRGPTSSPTRQDD